MRYSEFLYNCSVRTGLSVKFIKSIADIMFEEIILQLAHGKKVKIAKFGTFDLRRRSIGNSAGYIKLTQTKLVKTIFNLLKKNKKE